jgi:hypothetical protein
MKLRSFGLFLETIVFTIVVPGTVTVLIPSWILGDEAQFLSQPGAVTSFVALLPLSLGAAIYFRCLGSLLRAVVGSPYRLIIPGSLS